MLRDFFDPVLRLVLGPFYYAIFDPRAFEDDLEARLKDLFIGLVYLALLIIQTLAIYLAETPEDEKTINLVLTLAYQNAVYGIVVFKTYQFISRL